MHDVQFSTDFSFRKHAQWKGIISQARLFSASRANRTSSIGGGVAIYVNEKYIKKIIFT